MEQDKEKSQTTPPFQYPYIDAKKYPLLIKYLMLAGKPDLLEMQCAMLDKQVEAGVLAADLVQQMREHIDAERSKKEAWLKEGEEIMSRVLGKNTLQEAEDYISKHPPSAGGIVGLALIAEWNARRKQGKKAIEARHSKAGGSREKQHKIRRIWASGKYTSRDICAEQECADLGMSFSAARKALRNTPDPQINKTN